MFDLSAARQEIDAIDEEIRDLIAERIDKVAAIHANKIQVGLPVWDQDRVNEILDYFVQDFGLEQGSLLVKAIVGTKEDWVT